MNQDSSCPPVFGTRCSVNTLDWHPENLFLLTDCNSPLEDKNNCAVIALSVVADIEYDLANKILKAAGRKKTGVTPTFWKIGKILPFKLKSHVKFVNNWHKRKTLWTFIKNHPKGRYFVEVGGYTNGHALAVIHGVVVDSNYTSPYAKVRGAWSIEGLKKGAL